MNRIELAAVSDAEMVTPLAMSEPTTPVLCTPTAAAADALITAMAAAFGIAYYAARAGGYMERSDFDVPAGKHGLREMSASKLIGFRRELSAC
ncbi:MAG TPA: hypothetical protein VJT49_15315 [Amycolatopsis sp.]|uniref:hypothetical protein n=1 Tax=Amycolatopsis sp. TaxID=37632 RepID=UPI002B4896E3|nr:hypothetical protein [Amycolatopsis sp.]HKS46448.1 hypothetical protein [Amycolatopsis sp.]